MREASVRVAGGFNFFFEILSDFFFWELGGLVFRAPSLTENICESWICRKFSRKDWKDVIIKVESFDLSTKSWRMAKLSFKRGCRVQVLEFFKTIFMKSGLNKKEFYVKRLNFSKLQYLFLSDMSLNSKFFFNENIKNKYFLNCLIHSLVKRQKILHPKDTHDASTRTSKQTILLCRAILGNASSTVEGKPESPAAL